MRRNGGVWKEDNESDNNEGDKDDKGENGNKYMYLNEYL